MYIFVRTNRETKEIRYILEITSKLARYLKSFIIVTFQSKSLVNLSTPYRNVIMSFSSQPDTIGEIKTVIIKLWSDIESLKKKNEDLSFEVKDLKKSNEGFKEELSTVKDELKQFKRNESIKNFPIENALQNTNEKNKQISELEQDEASIDLDAFAIEERIVCTDEENKNYENPGNRRQPTTARAKRFSSVVSSWLRAKNKQTSCTGNVYNTNTLCMLAASIAYQRVQNPGWKTSGLMWMMAWLLLLFLFMQVFLLSIVQLDSAHPTCTKHTDCEDGAMCDGFGDFYRQPRCEPCASLELYGDSCNLDVSLKGFFSSSWFDREKLPHFNQQSDDISDLFNSAEDQMLCITQQYCEQNSPFAKSTGCTIITPLIEKASGSGYMVFFVMSIFFAVYLYKDMEEAEVENALLDFIILVNRRQVA